MTGGIGNPDWQRRYTFSAVPLFTVTLPDNVNSTSTVQDSNGYQYLLVNFNIGASTAYSHVYINWYQDQALTVLLSRTDFTTGPQSSGVVKVPVMTRYYTFEMGNVGGATGHTWFVAIYGTNADQENLLIQNTAIPVGYASASVAAGATMTTNIVGMFGGEVMLSMDDGGNNKWTAWVDYYDWVSQQWLTIWSAHGADKGQAYAERIFLTYAPVRMNFRNDDTVAHILSQRMLAK